MDGRDKRNQFSHLTDSHPLAMDASQVATSLVRVQRVTRFRRTARGIDRDDF